MRKIIFSLISLSIFLQASAIQGSITPQIEVNKTSGPAPLAVSFDATGTSHSDSATNTNRFHELTYLWNYGDPDSGTWTPTGNSRNEMTGALGAHIFEPTSYPDCGGTCKTFTVTLTVEDEAVSTSTTKTITVYDPNHNTQGWGATGKTVCISRVSAFGGCPAGATTLNSTAEFTSILSTQIAAGVRRILFNGGETWVFGGNYTVSAAGPGLIGSYGGSAANLDLVTGDLFFGGDHWRFQDFHFEGSAGETHQFKNSGQVSNLLLQRIEIDDGASDSVLDFGNVPGDDSNMHRHNFIVDNDWGSLASGLGYHAYTRGWGLFIMGNTIGSSALGQHSVRINMGEDVLISNNEMGPEMDGKTVINLRDVPNVCGSCPGNAFCGRATKYYIIQDNTFHTIGSSAIGAGGQSCLGPDDPIENLQEFDYIFERNYTTPVIPTSYGLGLTFSLGRMTPVRMMIRNNIFDMTGYNSPQGVTGTFSGTKVLNNTCYRSDVNVTGVGQGGTDCIKVYGATEVSNNVSYAPNWHDKSKIKVLNVSTPAQVTSSNVSNAPGGGIISSPFGSIPSDPKDRTREHFIPGNGSVLIDSGSPTGIVHDNLGHCITGPVDIGAIEQGATPCSFPGEDGGGPGLPDPVPAAPVLLQ